MRPDPDTTRRTVAAGAALAGAALGLGIAGPAQASAAPAQVRFLHAVPGAGSAVLASGDSDMRAAFGHVSGYRSMPTGTRHLVLRPSGGGAALARATEALAPGGRYTVVASSVDGRVRLRAYADATSRRAPSSTLLRMVHAAPELGAPDIRFDGARLAAKVPFGATSGYVAATPGRHAVALDRPGTTRSLLSAKVSLRRGRPTTVFVIGSRGEEVRALAVRDTASTGRLPTAPDAPTGTYTIRRGDTLWSLARRRMGSNAPSDVVARESRRLYLQNATSVGSDPNRIMAGERVRL